MCKNTNHTHESIQKFDNFLVEEKIAKLLLEGNLMASDRFLSRLSSINNNQIATDLHRAFSDKIFIDKDLTQNWVDVTDKEDTVSFMPDRAASRINTSTIFDSKSRNEVKIGRFVRAILNELGKKVTDKDVEIFVNSYKSSKEDKTKKFELVSGPIIKNYYLHRNYSKTTGTLGGSCMRGEDCQRYFKIYTKNPEVCQLLVYLDENDKVLGRAIVWKIYKKELYKPDETKFDCDCEYFMDRVYTSNDSDIIKFVNYAKQKGWMYKQKMTSDERLGMIFKYNDETILGKIIVKLQRLHFSKYPYVDTLKFTNGDSMIGNVGFTIDEDNEDSDEGFIMSDTDGDHSSCDTCNGTGFDDNNSNKCRKCDGDGEVNCPSCKGSTNIICTKCDGDGEIKCNNCDGDGDVDCNNCGGDGEIKCNNCDGDGTKKCKHCDGVGDMGECKECNGDGVKECSKCKGQDITCVGCKGVGEITRKWGNGTRRVKCPDCAGDGKSSNGEVGRDGCRCGECSFVVGRTTWRNRHVVDCDNCDGDGKLTCTQCDGNGETECEKCDGQGNNKCDKCHWGRLDCKECKGGGTLGKCEECKGKGTLGKCKSCSDGHIKCDTCNGSGEKPKGEGKQLCPDCSGIFDSLISDISAKKYRILN